MYKRESVKESEKKTALMVDSGMERESVRESKRRCCNHCSSLIAFVTKNLEGC